MKLLFVTVLFMLSNVLIKAQDINYFEKELLEYKKQLKASLYTIKNVEELKDYFSFFENEINSFESDFERYINRENIPSYIYKPLMLEISTIQEFVCQRPRMVCLTCFNKLIYDLGGNKVLVKEKNGVKYKIATIGNFKFYYIYSNYYYDYNITIKIINENKINKDTINIRFIKYSFHIAGEIEIFNISKKSEYWKLSIFLVENKGKPSYSFYNEYHPNRNRHEFPRN